MLGIHLSNLTSSKVFNSKSYKLNTFTSVYVYVPKKIKIVIKDLKGTVFNDSHSLNQRCF